MIVMGWEFFVSIWEDLIRIVNIYFVIKMK